MINQSHMIIGSQMILVPVTYLDHCSGTNVRRVFAPLGVMILIHHGKWGTKFLRLALVYICNSCTLRY